MADLEAREAIELNAKRLSKRSTWESHWREIARKVLVRQDQFYEEEHVPGEKRAQEIFDSTAPLALERYAAAMESMLTPRTQVWHAMRSASREFDEDMDVKRYLDEVVQLLFRFRYAPAANFSSQYHETYMSNGAFGTGAVFIDEMVETGIRYRSCHLSEVVFDESHSGVIDVVDRMFTWTARQAAQRFGLENLPDKLKKAYEKDDLNLFKFLHCVLPNTEQSGSAIDHKGMPIKSRYINVDEEMTVEHGGYNSMPYAISRNVTAPREIYGRSPAMTVLADIKTLNEMEKTLLRTGQRHSDPPLLVHKDGILGAFSQRPNAMNYGGLDDQGRQLVQEMQLSGNMPLNMEMSEQKRGMINDAFLVTLFQILVESPSMTATEAMIRAQEKGALLAPTMGRQQSELLGPTITRELDIHARAGRLPPMPEQLREAGGEVDVEYTSPLNRLQRAEDGVAIMRTMESLQPFENAQPGITGIIFNVVETGRELAEINGVPAKVLNSKTEAEDLMAQDKEQQQLMGAASMAPGAADAIKTISEVAPPA